MKLYKVKKSKIDNLGLYAAKDIKKGTKISHFGEDTDLNEKKCIMN